MKKFIALALVFVLCLALACPALAETGEFMPSVGYKDTPEIEAGTVGSVPGMPGIGGGEDGEEVDITPCLIITSIGQAEAGSTDITQAERDLLLDIFKQLSDGTMKLPVGGDYVVRDLFDISFEHDDCREIEEHGHKDQVLKQEGVRLTLTLNTGVGADEKVIVMSYIDGKWVEAVSVVNNGDGTITVVFEDICPVAILTRAGAQDGPSSPINPSTPQTGDTLTSQIGIWLIVLAVCAVGLVLVLVIRPKKQND